MRVLELFAGIGGVACCLPTRAISIAVDISQAAAQVYGSNHPHAYHVREIAALPHRFFTDAAADLWWMSPPCQPFSRRGARRGLDDPRSQALKHIISTIAEVLPPTLALENVVGFAGSDAHELLVDMLCRSGYRVLQRELCPSQFGWPNRRPRFYLLASRCERIAAAWMPHPRHELRLQAVLEDTADGSPLWLADEFLQRWRDAMDRVGADSEHAIAACFASSYGRASVRSGSYLRIAGRYRLFSPREVARLLGFPDSFELVDYRLSSHPLAAARRQWQLLGNSLSLPAVRYVLQHFLDQ